MSKREKTLTIKLTSFEVQEAIAEWMSQRPPYQDHFEHSDVYFDNAEDALPDGFVYIQTVEKSE